MPEHFLVIAAVLLACLMAGHVYFLYHEIGKGGAVRPMTVLIPACVFFALRRPYAGALSAVLGLTVVGAYPASLWADHALRRAG